MKIFSASQIKAWDQYTIAHEAIRSLDLMERASLIFTNWFIEKFPDSNEKITIFCGSGNNGGDGLAIARLLHRRFYEVNVVLIHMSQKSPDFKANQERLPREIPVSTLDYNHPPDISKNSILIDAIFGSGLNRPVEGELGTYIQHLNQLDNRSVSVDVPSGFFIDQQTEGISFIPDFTFSFQSPKLAFFFPENEKKLGEWIFQDIQLSAAYEATTICENHYVSSHDIQDFLLPKRSKFSHKGTHGHAFLIAGSTGKMGAAILAARACLRSGVGLLTCQLPETTSDIMQISVPEAMCSNYHPNDLLLNLIPNPENYSCIGIGPGIEKNSTISKAIIKIIKNTDKPIVIDADALNILAERENTVDLIPENSILTPHPKEFQRLFGTSMNRWDQIEIGKSIAKERKCVIVLKGAYTCTILPDGNCYFNSTGNPGMATAGSGDVLTGIITALLAQGHSNSNAAIVGVYIHGLAGDFAAKKTGFHSLIASDIVEHLAHAFRTIEL